MGYTQELKYPVSFANGYDAGHRILSIGINKLQQESFHDYVLTNPENEAKKFISEMEVLLTGRVDAQPLCDKKATRDGIYAALDRLQLRESTYKGEGVPRELKKHIDSTTIIYVSGHGRARETIDGYTISYFYPYDASLKGVGSHPGDVDWNSLIPLSDFTNIRYFTPSKHVLFIFNLCYAAHAGFSGQVSFQAAVSPSLEEKARHLYEETIDSSQRTTKTNLYTSLTGRRAYQLIAASQTLSPAAEKPSNAYSPFADFLFKGLKGGAADDFGMITADSLAMYIRHQYMVGEIQHKDEKSIRQHMTPTHLYLVGHGGGDLVFTEKSRQSKDVEYKKEFIHGKTPRRCKALISLISPSSAAIEDMSGQDKTQWNGIEYHRTLENQEVTLPPQDSLERGPLRYLWLVHTLESGSVAEVMQSTYKDMYKSDPITVNMKNIDDPYSIQKSYDALISIIDDAIEKINIDQVDIIVDVTGSTTPMSIGAAMACRDRSILMQYCQPNHMAFAGGRPNTTRRAVPVELNPKPLSEKTS